MAGRWFLAEGPCGGTLAEHEGAGAGAGENLGVTAGVVVGVGEDRQGSGFVVGIGLRGRRSSLLDRPGRLSSLGFGRLRPGLLVSPWPGHWSALDTAILKAPPERQILRVDLTVDRDDARELAAEAWELAKLAAAYRGQAAVLRRTTERFRARPPSGRVALRTFASTMATIFSTIAVDPGLPTDRTAD